MGRVETDYLMTMKNCVVWKSSCTTNRTKGSQINSIGTIYKTKGQKGDLASEGPHPGSDLK